MASQRITIAKIAGAAGLAVTSQFREWSGLRVSDDPDEWESAQWPISAREEIDSFVSNLRTHGHELPVVFFQEHVDFWLMGGDYQRWLAPEYGPRAIEVHSDRFQVWCYPLHYGEVLAERLKAATRFKRILERIAPEERWFILSLLESVQAWESLVEVAALVVVREVHGGLVMDSELESSLQVVPDWVGGMS